MKISDTERTASGAKSHNTVYLVIFSGSVVFAVDFNHEFKISAKIIFEFFSL